MKRYLAEFLGTFAIVFCGTGAIIIDQQTNGAITHPGIAITFGLVVMAMIYALGNVSGAHFNPAVSIAFALAGKFRTNQILPYIISQLTGALFASYILSYLFPTNEYLGTTLPAGSAIQAFILEFILTFFLMLVIIHVATANREQAMFAGIVVGTTVLLEAMFAGPICGASMNPARSFAPALVSGHTEHLWVYIFATILGAALAIPTWKFLNQKEKE